MSKAREAADRIEAALDRYPLSWHVEVDPNDIQTLIDAVRAPVFVVETSDVESAYVHGVYTTREQAEAALEELTKTGQRRWVEQDIWEQEIDSPPSPYGARWT